MNNKKYSILIYHSSAELYGSDKSLLDFVRGRPEGVSVVVVLPESGPLVDELKASGALVYIGEVAKIRRDMLSVRGIIRLISRLSSAIKLFRSLRNKHQFDVVYSNTVAILAGAISAKFYRIPHVWHVREIASQSKAQTKMFQLIVDGLSETVLCNSEQTRNWVRPDNYINSSTGSKYIKIWNGYDREEGARTRTSSREWLGAKDNELLFVFVGRINAWKGQLLLIDAFEKMVQRGGANCRLAIVGSAFSGQDHYERELETRIKNSPQSNLILWHGFCVDIQSVWDAADVAVVPSLEPEPFGRVAIEAMAHGAAVIASAHGGLLDIVVDGVTGRLVQPNDAQSLSDAMFEMYADREKLQRMSDQSVLRQKSVFSVRRYVDEVMTAFVNTIENKQI